MHPTTDDQLHAYLLRGFFPRLHFEITQATLQGVMAEADVRRIEDRVLSLVEEPPAYNNQLNNFNI